MPICPGTSAPGRLDVPSPPDVTAACLMKPSHVSEEVGNPAASHTALARNTAGVQLPQHAMPDMTASTPRSRSFCGSAASAAFSLPPCVLPKVRQLTKLMPG